MLMRRQLEKQLQGQSQIRSQLEKNCLSQQKYVDRMEQNINIWDFTLTDDEMQTIAAKDLGHSEIVNHDDPVFVKFIHNYH